MNVEGYGLTCCVASLTDALTSEQVEELIKLSCRDVVIAWDKGVSKEHILEPWEFALK